MHRNSTYLRPSCSSLHGPNVAPPWPNGTTMVERHHHGRKAPPWPKGTTRQQEHTKADSSILANHSTLFRMSSTYIPLPCDTGNPTTLSYASRSHFPDEATLDSSGHRYGPLPLFRRGQRWILPQSQTLHRRLFFDLHLTRTFPKLPATSSFCSGTTDASPPLTPASLPPHPRLPPHSSIHPCNHIHPIKYPDLIRLHTVMLLLFGLSIRTPSPRRYHAFSHAFYTIQLPLAVPL